MQAILILLASLAFVGAQFNEDVTIPSVGRPTTEEMSTFERIAQIPVIIAKGVGEGKSAVQVLEMLESEGYDVPEWVKYLVQVFSLIV